MVGRASALLQRTFYRARVCAQQRGRGEQMDLVFKVVDEAAGLLRSFRAYRRAYFMSRDFRQRS
jgi:hypothetical protein